MILLNKARKEYSHKDKKNEKTSGNICFKLSDKENNAIAANLIVNYEDSHEVSIIN